jgi:DNA-binding CsgD family transcriptional regulator
MPQHNNSSPAHHSVPALDERRAAGSSVIILMAAVARARAAEQAGTAIVRQLNGPLTALMLYMGEIKQHSDKFARTPAEREYLQMIVENALEQTERVCALVKQISCSHVQLAAGSNDDAERIAADHTEVAAVNPSEHQLSKPLTRREREVLKLISEGNSNKQGALRMSISPRTFESHRAEAMRKLGVRNTAELVRAALLIPLD